MSEIGELFARDPLHLTTDDRRKIIEHFRASRAQFMAAGTRTKSETAAPKPKKEKITGLSLDDLDI